MSENEKNENTKVEEEQLSLNDDRRVKVLSPGALVAKRFLRSSLAVTGLVTLIIMFIFSYIGGLITPYEQDQIFYRTEGQIKDYAGVVENKEFRYAATDDRYSGVVQAQSLLAIQKGSEEFAYRGISYTVASEGKDFYSIAQNGELIGIAYKDIVNPPVQGQTLSFDFTYAALKAYAAEVEEENADPNAEAAPISFSVDGVEYTVDDEGTIFAGEEEAGYISRYVIKAIMPDVILTRDFRDIVVETMQAKEKDFVFVDADGNEFEYILEYDASHDNWAVKQDTATRVIDTYSFPSKDHWLGTDGNGMDMLTRLMYGGRVSLMVGFIVVIIETVLGVIMGGLAGYFGGWVDEIIMRLVDIFYCIPSMPIIIILGAAMDAMRVDPGIRMIYLMLILGFLGWAGIARLVRGQILSLREQEFMTATEATGIRVSRRIFKHLIPNVIPQLIVSMTMGLGSTIITEATLSFLGLGVRFPFASWGNIINDVNNTFVLTSYWFIWIPAGVCLMLTVLAFNLVGDGLRDAFDPKMKR